MDTHLDQELLDRLCDQLAVPRHVVVPEGGLPDVVRDELSRRFAVAGQNQCEVGRAVIDRAGMRWTADCDTRRETGPEGAVVTTEGLFTLSRAVSRLLRSLPTPAQPLP